MSAIVFLLSAVFMQEATSLSDSIYSKANKLSKVATYDNPPTLSSNMEPFKV
jgi:hypothetical protein